jgi:ribosomal protein L19
VKFPRARVKFFKKNDQASQKICCKTKARRYQKVTIVEETLASVGPFIPRPPIGNLPKVHNINPTTVQLQHHPRYRYPAQSLMRAIDIENRFRYDTDKRTNLFFSNDRIRPGSILLVEMISSRVNPQKRSFAGVLLGVTERGLMSNITILSQVMGVGVEMKIPIYSPMVQKFLLVKEAPESFREMKSVYWLREKKHPDIQFEEIENIVIKYKNQQSRLNK